MSPNTDEIGVNVHHTTNTELGKENLDVPKNEEETRFTFPHLSPARAVLNLSTGDLIEIISRPSGMTDTVEGLKNEKDEWFDETYRTKKGQDWGGIIQHHYIGFTRHQCPKPNEHGEIPVPTERPDDSDIVNINPTGFATQELHETDFRSYPLLLLERPEVSYEETTPGDTYDIVGWYDPTRSSPSNRICPTTTIVQEFPEICEIEHDRTRVYHLGLVDDSIEYSAVTNNGIAEVSQADGDESYTLSSGTNERNHHVTIGTAFDERRFLIESPYETRTILNDLPGEPRWDPSQQMWAVKASSETLQVIIESLVEEAGTISLSQDLLDSFADKKTRVTVHDDIGPVNIADILSYVFVEEVTVDKEFSVSGVPQFSHPDEENGKYVVFDSQRDKDSVRVTYEDSDAGAIMETYGGNRIKLDCSEDQANLVKDLDWKASRYEWKNSVGAWTLNKEFASTLIRTFISEEETLSVAVELIKDIGDEKSVTEQREMSIDQSEVIDVPSQGTQLQEVVTDIVTNAGEFTPSETSRLVHGIVPNNSGKMRLGNLDIELTSANSAGVSIHMESSQIPELRPSVKDQWQPSIDVDESIYQWYHPHSGAEITVSVNQGEEGPASFGATDYEISVKDPEKHEQEHIVTVNDERAATMAVITQMNLFSR